VREWLLAHPSQFYFGALLLAMLGVVAALTAPTRFASQASAGWMVVAVLLAFLPAADAAIAIVHQLVMLVVPPDRLPRLDYQQSVPESDRTTVVVPLLFGSLGGVARALEHIEVQYLANRDPQVRFALLSDFLDSPSETAPGDDEIVAAAVDGIRALNSTYAGASDGASHDSPFYLLHRRRRWNAADAVWMGWERKRGKLVDFNAFISGANDDAFSVTEGALPWLLGVRYVITLDADTMLPRGAAAALIGTLAHPLNRAEFDSDRGRVTRGYGILQPRVSVSLASASESRFAAVYSGHPGVDPYTTAVSDVYQDLFGEGTFTGKGIYDVDVFRRATEGRFPDNTLPQSRSDRGTFARAWSCDGRGSIRRLPDALSDGNAADAPVDSRRLAVAALVDAARSRPDGLDAQSALGALAVEDRRQHAAQRQPDRDDHLASSSVDDSTWLWRRLDGDRAGDDERAMDCSALCSPLRGHLAIKHGGPTTPRSAVTRCARANNSASRSFCCPIRCYSRPTRLCAVSSASLARIVACSSGKLHLRSSRRRDMEDIQSGNACGPPHSSARRFFCSSPGVPRMT
jgi:hypothetical protein